MWIYIIIFLISSFFSYLGYKEKNKKICIFFSMLAILLPSALAGLRARGVGTDTLYYIDASFRYAKTSTSFSQLMKICDIEILYNLVNYVVSRFTHNINWLYFVLQLLICGITYIACYKNKKICAPWFSYLLFMLLFFNRSLNMCRQTIAIVLILYSFTFATEKKPLKFFLTIIIAIGFHRTAIIFLPCYFLINIIRKKDKFIYKILIFLLFLTLFFGYTSIIKFIIEIGLISSRYLYYVSSEESNIILIELIFKLVILFLILIFNKNLKTENEYNHIFTYFMLLDILMYCTGIYANYAQRLSYYFGYYIIYLIPQFSNIFKNLKARKIITIFILLLTLVYSYLYYDVAGYDETTPYVSIFNLEV